MAQLCPRELYLALGLANFSADEPSQATSLGRYERQLFHKGRLHGQVPTGSLKGQSVTAFQGTVNDRYRAAKRQLAQKTLGS